MTHPAHEHPPQNAAERVLQRDWEKLDPHSLTYPITQTTWQERALLSWAASDYYTGAGEIIDAGCLAGSSSHALGTGLLRNTRVSEKAGRVHSYDLFRFEDYMRAAFSNIGEGERSVGSSFLDLFERLTADAAPAIATHAGDFTEKSWDGRPIEVLFVDLAKNWELEHHCAAQFFPALIPGQSLLIQQDYFHVWCPWIHLRMDIIRDYVKFLCYVPSGSAVFLVEKPIPKYLAALDLRAHLDPLDQIAKLARIARAFEGDAWGFVTLARSVLMVHQGQLDEAERLTLEVDAVAGLGQDIRAEAWNIRAWITGRRK